MRDKARTRLMLLCAGMVVWFGASCSDAALSGLLGDAVDCDLADGRVGDVCDRELTATTPDVDRTDTLEDDQDTNPAVEDAFADVGNEDASNGKVCFSCEDTQLMYWDLGQSGAAPMVLVSDDSSVPRYALRGTFSAAAPQMAASGDGVYQLRMAGVGGGPW